MRLFAVALVVSALASPVLGHGGGLDASGGHYNRKTGSYHYHRGGGSLPPPKREPVEQTRRPPTPRTDVPTVRLSPRYAPPALPALRGPEAPPAAVETSTVPAGVTSSVTEERTAVADAIWREAQVKRDAGDLLTAIVIATHVARKYEGTPAADAAKAFLAEHPDEVAARELLALARNYKEAGNIEKAREFCERILTKFPATRCAVAARKLVAEMQRP